MHRVTFNVEDERRNARVDCAELLRVEGGEVRYRCPACGATWSCQLTIHGHLPRAVSSRHSCPRGCNNTREKREALRAARDAGQGAGALPAAGET